MPYLINIGSGGTNRLNKSGVGSRGYQIFRTGKEVICRWAGISVGAKREFRWTRAPQEKRYAHGSAAAAQNFLALRLHAMTRPGAGYSVLPAGVRIAPTARSRKPRTSGVRVSRKLAVPRGITHAISIRQPLVELILRGEKRWELRSQPTNLRERVFLYASLQPFKNAAQWRKVGKQPGALPTGCIVGSVEITDCIETADGEYRYKLAAPRRLRPARTPRNQAQPRFWLPRF